MLEAITKRQWESSKWRVPSRVERGGLSTETWLDQNGFTAENTRDELFEKLAFEDRQFELYRRCVRAYREKYGTIP